MVACTAAEPAGFSVVRFGSIVAGALVVETVYSWPGLGRLFDDAIFRRDFPLLTGLLIFASTVLLILNALTDLACAPFDPRLRR